MVAMWPGGGGVSADVTAEHAIGVVDSVGRAADATGVSRAVIGVLRTDGAATDTLSPG